MNHWSIFILLSTIPFITIANNASDSQTTIGSKTKRHISSLFDRVFNRDRSSDLMSVFFQSPTDGEMLRLYDDNRRFYGNDDVIYIPVVEKNTNTLDLDEDYDEDEEDPDIIEVIDDDSVEDEDEEGSEDLPQVLLDQLKRVPIVNYHKPYFQGNFKTLPNYAKLVPFQQFTPTHQFANIQPVNQQFFQTQPVNQPFFQTQAVNQQFFQTQPVNHQFIDSQQGIQFLNRQPVAQIDQNANRQPVTQSNFKRLPNFETPTNFKSPATVFNSGAFPLENLHSSPAHFQGPFNRLPHFDRHTGFGNFQFNIFPKPEVMQQSSQFFMQPFNGGFKILPTSHQNQLFSHPATNFNNAKFPLTFEAGSAFNNAERNRFFQNKQFAMPFHDRTMNFHISGEFLNPQSLIQQKLIMNNQQFIPVDGARLQNFRGHPEISIGDFPLDDRRINQLPLADRKVSFRGNQPVEALHANPQNAFNIRPHVDQFTHVQNQNIEVKPDFLPNLDRKDTYRPQNFFQTELVEIRQPNSTVIFKSNNFKLLPTFDQSTTFLKNSPQEFAKVHKNQNGGREVHHEFTSLPHFESSKIFSKTPTKLISQTVNDFRLLPNFEFQTQFKPVHSFIQENLVFGKVNPNHQIVKKPEIKFESKHEKNLDKAEIYRDFKLLPNFDRPAVFYRQPVKNWVKEKVIQEKFDQSPKIQVKPILNKENQDAEVYRDFKLLPNFDRPAVFHRQPVKNLVQEKVLQEKFDRKPEIKARPFSEKGNEDAEIYQEFKLLPNFDRPTVFLKDPVKNIVQEKLHQDKKNLNSKTVKKPEIKLDDDAAEVYKEFKLLPNFDRPVIFFKKPVKNLVQEQILETKMNNRIKDPVTEMNVDVYEDFRSLPLFDRRLTFTGSKSEVSDRLIKNLVAEKLAHSRKDPKSPIKNKKKPLKKNKIEVDEISKKDSETETEAEIYEDFRSLPHFERAVFFTKPDAKSSMKTINNIVQEKLKNKNVEDHPKAVLEPQMNREAAVEEMEAEVYADFKLLPLFDRPNQFAYEVIDVSKIVTPNVVLQEKQFRKNDTQLNQRRKPNRRRPQAKSTQRPEIEKLEAITPKSVLENGDRNLKNTINSQNRTKIIRRKKVFRRPVKPHLQDNVQSSTIEKSQLATTSGPILEEDGSKLDLERDISKTESDKEKSKLQNRPQFINRSAIINSKSVPEIPRKNLVLEKLYLEKGNIDVKEIGSEDKSKFRRPKPSEQGNFNRSEEMTSFRSPLESDGKEKSISKSENSNLGTSSPTVKRRKVFRKPLKQSQIVNASETTTSRSNLIPDQNISGSKIDNINTENGAKSRRPTASRKLIPEERKSHQSFDKAKNILSEPDVHFDTTSRPNLEYDQKILGRKIDNINPDNVIKSRRPILSRKPVPQEKISDQSFDKHEPILSKQVSNYETTSRSNLEPNQKVLGRKIDNIKPDIVIKSRRPTLSKKPIPQEKKSDQSFDKHEPILSKQVSHYESTSRSNLEFDQNISERTIDTIKPESVAKSRRPIVSRKPLPENIRDQSLDNPEVILPKPVFNIEVTSKPNLESIEKFSANKIVNINPEIDVAKFPKPTFSTFSSKPIPENIRHQSFDNPKPTFSKSVTNFEISTEKPQFQSTFEDVVQGPNFEWPELKTSRPIIQKPQLNENLLAGNEKLFVSKTFDEVHKHSTSPRPTNLPNSFEQTRRRKPAISTTITPPTTSTIITSVTEISEVTERRTVFRRPPSRFSSRNRANSTEVPRTTTTHTEDGTPTTETSIATSKLAKPVKSRYYIRNRLSKGNFSTGNSTGSDIVPPLAGKIAGKLENTGSRRVAVYKRLKNPGTINSTTIFNGTSNNELFDVISKKPVKKVVLHVRKKESNTESYQNTNDVSMHQPNI